jgi:predicted SprT family Zn-dependent metalloprotease
VSVLDYEQIEDLVRKWAWEIARRRNITIKFSNRIRDGHAMCYWREKPPAIHFNKQFIDLNKNNRCVLEELVKHECIHLLPGCHTHGKRFAESCNQFGVSIYGYSVDYINVKPRFATHCAKCGNYKAHFGKPRLSHCKKCGGKLKMFDYSDKYGN